MRFDLITDHMFHRWWSWSLLLQLGANNFRDRVCVYFSPCNLPMYRDTQMAPIPTYPTNLPTYIPVLRRLKPSIHSSKSSHLSLSIYLLVLIRVLIHVLNLLVPLLINWSLSIIQLSCIHPLIHLSTYLGYGPLPGFQSPPGLWSIFVSIGDPNLNRLISHWNPGRGPHPTPISLSIYPFYPPIYLILFRLWKSASIYFLPTQ